MKRVFISYSREDGDFADNLRHTLEADEIPTWQDTDLYGGQSWRAEIDLAIQESLAVVVVMSSESAKSEYVAYEWAYALGVGVKVVPVLLKIAPEELHPALQSRQCLDFSSRSARPWDLLRRAVKETVPPQERTTIQIPPNAPPVLEQVVRALDSIDEKQRGAALSTLESMNHPVVTEVLVAAMSHPIEEVRRRAVRLLLERGDKRCLPAVLRSCRQGGSRGSKFGTYFLQSADWTVNDWNVNIEDLARLGAEVAPDLIAALASENDATRAVAAETLGAMRIKKAIPHLTRLLADPDEYVRASAFQALGRFKDAALLPIFQEAFRKDQEPLWALYIAADLPESGGESLLIEGLQHAHGGVREWAAQCVEPIATSASIDALRRAAKDTVRQVRYWSITALSRLDGPGNLDVFLDALEDEDSSVRSKAREALSKSGGPAVVARLLEILRTPDKMYRKDAARLLGEVGDESAIPALIDTLQDVEIIEEAVGALGKLVKPGMPAVAMLEKLASDSDKVIRDAARDGLCIIADPSSIHIFIQILNDVDEYAHSRAANALERLHKPEARRVLAEWRRKHR